MIRSVIRSEYGSMKRGLFYGFLVALCGFGFVVVMGVMG